MEGIWLVNSQLYPIEITVIHSDVNDSLPTDEGSTIIV